MVIEGGVEWPLKRQASVLAANSCWKRSTSFTPFYLMYGREANCAHLFKNLLNDGVDIDEDVTDNIADHSEEALPDVYPHEPELPVDMMENLAESRSLSRLHAQDNIRKEQMIQKQIFNKKVR